MRISRKLDHKALFKRIADGPLTVLATLREDTYETSFGDGYCAYVEQVFLTPMEAASAIENGAREPMIKLHIRRYDLTRSGDSIRIVPGPTKSEPTTVDAVVDKLGDCQMLSPSERTYD